MAKEKAAGLFLVNREDKILVGHPTKHSPNFWSIPKGKVEDGETRLQAAIRETYEESNVKLFSDLHKFVELGRFVYNHKKKDIVIFAHFETKDANWSKNLNIRRANFLALFLIFPLKTFQTIIFFIPYRSTFLIHKQRTFL